MSLSSLKYVAVIPAICAALSLHAQTSSDPKLTLNPGTEDELVIDLKLTAPVVIDPNTGGLSLSTLDPNACSGSNDCQEPQIQVNPFELSPPEVEQGSSFTATLSSVGAWECRRDGLSGTSWNLASTTPPPDGNVSVFVDSGVEARTTPYTLRYECENAGKVVVATANLVVSQPTDPQPDPEPPAGCEDVPLPTSWSRDTTALAGDSTSQTRTWIEAFELQFPSGNTGNIAANRNQYIAFEIDPGNIPQNGAGGLQFNTFASQPSGDIGQTTPTISISECPGDFRPQADPNCRKVNATQLLWTADPNNQSRCSIDTSKTRYFVNIVYAGGELSNPDDPASWFYSCPDNDDPDRASFPECGSLLGSFFTF